MSVRAWALLCGTATGLLAQNPRPGNPPEIAPPTIGDVRIGADEDGRSELCEALRTLLKKGLPRTTRRLDAAVEARCQGRPARVFVLGVTGDAKRVLCDYATAPASLLFAEVRLLRYRAGEPPLAGEGLAERLEPLGVRSLGDLLGAFAFERIDAVDRDGVKIAEAPIHQIDAYCAGAG